MSLTDARTAAAAARAQLAAGADPLDQRREARDATRAQAIERRRAPTVPRPSPITWRCACVRA